MKLTREQIDKIVANEEFESVNNEAKKEYIGRMNNAKVFSYMNYLDRWAKTIQYMHNKTNMPIEKAAQDTMDACNYENLDSMHINAVVMLLSNLWKHGDKLMQWWITPSKAEQERGLESSERSMEYNW